MDFLQFLMDNEAEAHSSSSVIQGFPINQKIFNKQAQQLAKAGKLKTDSKQEISVNKGVLDQLKNALTDATHWQYAPSNLNMEETIYKESDSYFSGQKSAEAVAKLVQNKVNLQLNE